MKNEESVRKKLCELCVYCYVFCLGENFFSDYKGRDKDVSVGEFSRRNCMSIGKISKKYRNLQTEEMEKRLVEIRGERETDYHQVLATGVEMESIKNGVELVGITFQDLEMMPNYVLVSMIRDIRSGAKSINPLMYDFLGRLRI
jgi:hypothetical protein